MFRRTLLTFGCLFLTVSVIQAQTPSRPFPQTTVPSTGAPTVPSQGITTIPSTDATITFDTQPSQGCACNDHYTFSIPKPSSWYQRMKESLKDKWERKKENCYRMSCSYGKGLGDTGCGSWRNDTIFIFGSSHDFFEEPCRRQPPIPSPRQAARNGW